ncbi:MAG: hypothetical protein ACK5N8_04545 [Alphaproteobacteria bacterium]
MNMEERLQSTVTQAEADGLKWHKIIHGNETCEVETENGKVPSVAKQLKDIRFEITGGVSDVVSEAQQARDEANAAKVVSEELRDIFEALNVETKSFRDETEVLKDLSQTTFNNIATSTAISISEVQQEGNTQIGAIQAETVNKISEIKREGENQIALATEQARRAETEANLVNYPIVFREETSGILEIDWSLQEDYIFSLTGAFSLSFINLPKNDRIGWFRLLILEINSSGITFGAPTNLLYADDVVPTLNTGKIYQLAIQYISSLDKFFVSTVEY